MPAKCPACGAPMEHDTCGYCGYGGKKATDPIDSTESQQQPIQPPIMLNNQMPSNIGVIPGISKKSKLVALLLCIFLGCFGVHRFYVGKVGTGVLYLFTLGICGIGWLIDIILIATGAFTDEFGLLVRQ